MVRFSGPVHATTGFSDLTTSTARLTVAFRAPDGYPLGAVIKGLNGFRKSLSSASRVKLKQGKYFVTAQPPADGYVVTITLGRQEAQPYPSYGPSRQRIILKPDADQRLTTTYHPKRR